MKIGIISDTHNNIHNTEMALDRLSQQSVSLIIHCGDINTPRMLGVFAGWPVRLVFGNTDYDRRTLNTAAEIIGLPLIQDTFSAQVDGVGLAACHGHDTNVLDGLIGSGLYQFVFHGHTHRRRNELVRGVRVINPGALGGLKRETYSFCTIDLVTKAVEYFAVAA